MTLKEVEQIAEKVLEMDYQELADRLELLTGHILSDSRDVGLTIHEFTELQFINKKLYDGVHASA